MDGCQCLFSFILIVMKQTSHEIRFVIISRDGDLMRSMWNRIFWIFSLVFNSVLYCITAEICDIALFAFLTRIIIVRR